MGQPYCVLVMEFLIVADHHFGTIVARIRHFDRVPDEYTARMIARPLNHSMIDTRELYLARVGDRILEGQVVGRGSGMAMIAGEALLAKVARRYPLPKRGTTVAWVWPDGQLDAAVEVPRPTMIEQADNETHAAIARGEITVNPDGSLGGPET